MKICFLTHNLKQDNGAGVFSLRLIEGLKETLNCEVSVLVSQPSGHKEEIPILFPSKFKLLKNFFRIREIIRKNDLIHALDAFPYGVIAYLASLGLGKKIIITAVGSGAIVHLYKPFYSWFLRRAYRAADKVIAVSNFTKNEILKRVKNLEIDVINHGVDFEKYNENTAESYEKLINLKPYILSVGSLRWRKGYHRSIKSFSEVKNKFPNLNYVIVGKKYDENYYQRLKKLIKDFGLEKKVFIFENINNDKELVQLYKGAEFFWLISQNVLHDVEGFGLVFLEAAAAGLPVVGSKNSGVEDAMRDGENGFLIGECDEKALTDVAIKILSNPELRIKMSKKSLEFAKNSNWESKIKEYEFIYKKLLKENV